MATLTEMKSQLTKLETKKNQLEADIQKANQRFKMSLWGIGIGVILLPVYWSGVPVLVIAGIMAIFYSLKQTNFRDKLESLESEIHKLEISMA